MLFGLRMETPRYERHHNPSRPTDLPALRRDLAQARGPRTEEVPDVRLSAVEPAARAPRARASQGNAMKRTEERKAAAIARAKARAEKMAKLPGARIECIHVDHGVIVKMEAGDDNTIEVMFRGQVARDGEAWSTMYIFCDEDPRALSGFIAALCARYNAIVERMNNNAQRCTVAIAQKTRRKT